MIRPLVVVPTHNEADNIGRLICELRHVLPTIDVLVVDDASSDDTRRIVHELAAADPALRIVERDANTVSAMPTCTRSGWRSTSSTTPSCSSTPISPTTRRCCR